MMETDNEVKFRMIAAIAENIAYMLKSNGAWPVDVQGAKAKIAKLLSEIQE